MEGQQVTTIQTQGAQPGTGTVTNNTTIIQTGPPMKPSSYLAFSIFVCLCCNFLLGIPAIIFSVLSSSAADEGNMETARKNGKIAMWLSIGGMIMTIVICIILPIALIVGAAKAVDNHYNNNVFGSNG